MKDGNKSLFDIHSETNRLINEAMGTYRRHLPKGMHSSSFQGKLYCPWWGCKNTSFTYEGKMSMFKLLYKCKKCGQMTAYDVSRQLCNPFIKDKNKLKTIDLGR